jgi:hypothetical protein
MSDMYVDMMSKQLDRSRDKYFLRNSRFNIPFIKINRSKSNERNKKRGSLGVTQLNIPVIKVTRSKSQVKNTLI